MIFYSNVLWKSDRKLNSRRFMTYRWKSSVQQPNELTETFWELHTEQRLSTFIECKKLELFLNGLDSTEFQGLVDAPGFFSDRLFLELMRALASCQNSKLDVQREYLLQKLEPLQSILHRPVWSKNLLYTYLGVLDYRLQLVRAPIGKVNKFSGWVRNSSAVGSKSKRTISRLDPEIQERLMDSDFDYYTYFMAQPAAFDDLGVTAGTLTYTFLKDCFQRRVPLPESLLYLFK